MDLSAIIAIVLIDLALSGDNALLIGMAARRLPDAQRRRAIVLGGGLAVVLRIAAAAIVTFLLAIPYLQLVGGIVLAVIAYRLVRPGGTDTHSSVQPASSMREAVLTILVADAAMSVENVLGVGGAAHGDLPVLRIRLGQVLQIVRGMWLFFGPFDDLMDDQLKQRVVRRGYALMRRSLTGPRRSRSCPRAVRQTMKAWPRLLQTQSVEGPFHFTLV